MFISRVFKKEVVEGEFILTGSILTKCQQSIHKLAFKQILYAGVTAAQTHTVVIVDHTD